MYEHFSCLTFVVIRNPSVVSTSAGTKVLLAAVVDPKYKDIAESIVMTFLFILDDANTRKFIRDGEIQTIFGPFTQEYTETEKKDQKAQWDCARKAIGLMMKRYV